MVGYCCWLVVAELADGVACEDCLSECFVALCCVAALCSGASEPVCLNAVCFASAAFGAVV